MTTITATARPSTTCPDRKGAVDATIYADGVEVGECTLLPSEVYADGRLDTWGECLSQWANDALLRAIEATGEGEDAHETIREIVAAVRAAAKPETE